MPHPFDSEPGQIVDDAVLAKTLAKLSEYEEIDIDWLRLQLTVKDKEGYGRVEGLVSKCIFLFLFHLTVSQHMSVVVVQYVPVTIQKSSFRIQKKHDGLDRWVLEVLYV